ncbi:Murein hydrolase activator NlpD precursor [Oligella ureolytica]|uniref:Murein hydrolase activator NlpD n=1 Tax=Oligella ureolytica TaxID=90244 RepID=A0A378XKH3_9BURK|nr:peptidoglycan DD-metalloendopeptidase family protein [Oligella ureolytica]QPT40033.1 peptidoglycan DD-metalloendopeptidase family protein [Oligella ureolytica]SUA58383.1 Murein hydrolase activator NlpD precursor [Oligella ureolytica]
MNRKIYTVGAICFSALLAACGSSSKAPITSAGGSGATSSAGTYVVQRGDTLYSIAQRHGTTVANLSSLNRISNPSQLEVGQRLTVRGGTAARSSASTATASRASAASSSQPTRAADAAAISWEWPVRGKVITQFSNTTRGIDIAGTVGTPINSAADGTVSYVGNGLRGLGNLVLVTHSNGFITAYAHNSRITVQTNERVKKGQKIAELGDTDATSPRLHFQVRRNGTPVNPLSYLPR